MLFEAHVNHSLVPPPNVAISRLDTVHARIFEPLMEGAGTPTGQERSEIHPSTIDIIFVT
jgi:hypothetical protein